MVGGGVKGGGKGECYLLIRRVELRMILLGKTLFRVLRPVCQRMMNDTWELEKRKTYTGVDNSFKVVCLQVSALCSVV